MLKTEKRKLIFFFINSLNNLILFIIVANIYALIWSGSFTTGLLIAQRPWKCLTVVSGEGPCKWTAISAALSGNVLVSLHFLHGRQFSNWVETVIFFFFFKLITSLITPKLLLNFLHLIYDFISQYITFRVAACQI